MLTFIELLKLMEGVVLRKWSFSNLSFQDDPSFELILGYWNFLSQTMVDIDKIFVDYNIVNFCFLDLRSPNIALSRSFCA